jgi:hypothetical protein
MNDLTLKRRCKLTIAQRSITTSQELTTPVVVPPSSQSEGLEDEKFSEVLRHAQNQELASWVLGCYQRCKSSRLQYEQQWMINYKFYAGSHYVEMQKNASGAGSFLTTPKAPGYRVRQIINRVRPIVRREISRLISQKPTALIVPASADDADMFAAHASEQLWDFLQRECSLSEKFENTVFWTVVTGTGFLKTYWDASACNEDGTCGKIRYESVTPYHIFIPDHKIIDIQEQPYIINAYVRSVGWVKQFIESIGIEFGEITPDAMSSDDIMPDMVMNTALSRSSEPNGVMCYELWAKPGAHRLLPLGGLVHVINGRVVYATNQGIPYRHGKYPFTKVTHTPTGKFYGSTVLDDLVPLQREYNRLRSQILENGNRMGNPQWIAPKGAINASKITPEPGLVIEYNPAFGVVPQQIVPVPMPAYIINNMQQVLTDIEDISAQHAVSKGSVPPGVEAATAIGFLQEQDDGYSTTAVNAIEYAYQSIANQSLHLIKQFWGPERTISAVGDDQSFDAIVFDATQISTSIFMEGGSALPQSKAAKQAFIMDCIRQGIMSPEDGLRLLDMGGTTTLYKQLRVDSAQAQRENVKMKGITEQSVIQHQQRWQQRVAYNDPNTVDPLTGTPMDTPPLIPVNSWDEHDVHIKVHNDFRKTQAYEMLPDAAKMEIEKHVNLHVAAVNDAMRQANLAMQMMGGPEQPGAPTPAPAPNDSMPLGG